MEGKDGRTERATPKRRNEERKKGHLCVSPEITTVLVLLLGALGIRYAVPNIMDQLHGLYIEVLRAPLGGSWSADIVQHWFIVGAFLIAIMVLPIVLPVMIAAVAANMAQTGPYLSFDAIHFNLKAINPVKGAKNLFSTHSITTFLLSMLKASLVLWVIYLVTRRRIIDLIGLMSLSVPDGVQWTFMLIFRMTIAVACLFILIASLDWVLRKYRHEKGMMMTKKEVEDERKQQEPSPVVRSAQRKKMRELSFQRMMAAVPKASVVITNPTHVAVALEYDATSMGAPKVTAKGLRLVAERIKRIAREHGIPVLERPEVARDMYKNVKVGQEIPARFYGVIAEILAYLYKMGQGRIRDQVGSRAPVTRPAPTLAEALK